MFLYKNLADHSALTNSKAHKLPLGHETNKKNEDIPISYVPLRNTFFLTLAAACLESIALKAIENGVTKAEKVQAKIYIAAMRLTTVGIPTVDQSFTSKQVRHYKKAASFGPSMAYPLVLKLH